MPRTPAAGGNQPPIEIVARVNELCRAGLMLQAHAAALTFAPLRKWQGLDARFVAADLAVALGAPMLGMAHASLAWREAPRNGQAAVRYACVVTARRGHLPALTFVDHALNQIDNAPDDRAGLLAYKASMLAHFRDFERAHATLDEALTLHPDNEAALLTRAQVMDSDDRHAEALDQIRNTLTIHPRSTVTLHTLGYLLHTMGRDDEAVQVLAEASRTFESAEFESGLALIHSEREDHEALAGALDRFERFSPLLERKGRRWLDAMRANVAWARGDRRGYLDLARRSGSVFHMAIASRVENHDAAGRRVLLPVGFVRQHYMTCAPATLSAISRFWERPADHVEIADEICYGGTTTRAERAWAESHGWAVREFTVTWDAAVALLDRGIPFTLGTRTGDSGHLQAVIGYDTARGTLFLRDPTIRHHLEASAEHLLASQVFCGPRGMAMVPADRSELLEGLTLSDAPLYDLYFRVESALKVCDRDTAMTELAAMEEASPGHRLCLLARHAVATFDADPAACRETLDLWLERYPDDVTMRARRLGVLEELGRRVEMRREMEEMKNSPHTHPVFWVQYGRFLSNDAREHEEAGRLIGAAVRAQPDNPLGYLALAELLLNTRRERALEVYRLAACLGGTDEAIPMAFFHASRVQGQEDDALAFLESRWRRLGARSPASAVTLARALVSLDQEQRAFEVLESAMQTHSEDGNLMLVLAQALQEKGRTEAAEILLRRAEGRCSASSHLAARARLALQRGDGDAARQAWTRVVERDPISVEAHRALATLDCSQSGPARVLAVLEAAVSRAPHHVGLRRLELEWVGLLRPDLVAAKARALVELSPRDPEARMVLCAALQREGRTDELVAQARTLLEIAPREPACAGAAGTILADAGYQDEARPLLHEALGGSVDLPPAINALVFLLAGSLEERRSALSHLASEIMRQPGSGEGLFAVARASAAAWAPEQLGLFLEKVLGKHGDMPAAWSALIQHHLRLGDAARGHALAQQAADRFALHPVAWVDLARTRAAIGDVTGEIEALERALQIKPSLREAVRSLARACRRAGRAEESIEQLRRQFPTEPPDIEHDGQVAEMLWEAGCRDEAVARMQRVVELSPRTDRGWDVLAAWSEPMGRELAVTHARGLVADRPDDPGVWIGLARALREPGQSGERLAAVWRAQELAPWDIEARDLEATILASQGQFKQALIACRPGTWGASPPKNLRGRRAWVLWARGDRADAMAAMREVVRDHPLSAWGWEQLRGWTYELGDAAGYVEAAERLVWLQGDLAIPRLHLGNALLLAGRRVEAKEALSLALRLYPDLLPAAKLLFDIQLADKELDAAITTLESASHLLPSHEVMSRRVRLLCARGERDQAIDLFRALCLTQQADWDAVSMAADALMEAGEGLRVCATLEGVLREPVHCAQALAVWVAVKLIRDHDVVRCMEMLSEVPDDSESWELAALQLIDRLREAGQRGSFLQFVSEHERSLHDRPRTWRMILETLIGWNVFVRARKWAEGWERHAALGPVACLKASFAFRGGEDDERAARALRYGLEKIDANNEALLAWSAFDAARADETETARRMLGALDVDNVVVKPHAFLAALAEGMLCMGSATRLRKSRFAKSRRWIRQAELRCPDFRHDPLLRGAFEQALRIIAARRGGPIAYLWREWRRPPRAA